MSAEDRELTVAAESVPSGDDAGREDGSTAGERRKQLPVWQETVLLLAVALGLAILIKALFVQAFYIPSESMEPGLVVNDRILVQKPSYWFGHPQRGDVVVFKDPGGWLGPEASAGPESSLAQGLAKVGLYPTGGHLVKRVIGVEGDVIVCCDKTGHLQVNGTSVEEKGYARPGTVDRAGSTGKCYGPMVGNCHWKAGPVPAGQVFVMGDNRAHSADSSVHLCVGQTECTDDPYVDVDDVVGKVLAVIWPARKARLEHRPDSFADVRQRDEQQ